MLSNYSFPKTFNTNYIDLDVIGGIKPNTEYALYITCDPTTITTNCWCGFITYNNDWCSNSVYYGDKRYIILETNENARNDSKLRLRGDKGLIIKHIRLVELATNSKYSRIERFLYALYSLDFSDLPNPLSRIEELYKCLVTGEEAPTFKPLSRVEKYLMAILGVYDANELPNPLSRVEVLLHKLATGDDNLDDVKSFLSEHEELLAEIIRNGGVGGNIDIEYVLYTLSTEFNTLYNTAEKPVKSAILSGKTLVNLLSASNIKASKSYHTIDYVHNLDTTKTYILKYRINQIPELNDVTDSGRLLKFEWYNGSVINGCCDIYNKDITVGRNNFIIINPYNDEFLKTNFSVWIPNYVSGDLDMDVMIIEYQEGMENWDIPYFEGMKSVQMPVLKTTGKNLFDGKLEYGILNANNGLPLNSNDYVRSQNFIPINCETITFTVINGECGLSFYYYDKDKNFISSKTKMKVSDDLSIPDGVAYLKFRTYPISDESITNNLNTQIQIEQGSVATPYEPHKSNILTTSEEVTLRGIGDVRDELDLNTGEYVQRIGEVVLNGSENWDEVPLTNKDDYLAFGTSLPLKGTPTNYSTNNVIDSHGFSKLKLDYADNGSRLGEAIIVHINGNLYFRMLKTRLSTPNKNGWLLYLQSNPIMVQYHFTAESVKTVDLSTVNQDGNDTKLSTFNDITHVTLSSEGLIPEAELEVATKNEEDLEDSSVYTTHTLSEEFNTLYNTAEKPVKSAILKGKMLVNLANRELKEINVNINNSYYLEKNLTDNINSTKKYLIRHNYSFISGDASSPLTTILFYDNNGKYLGERPINESNFTHIITPNEGTTRAKIRLGRYGSLHTSSYIYRDIMLIEYQDGMENWDIPYFEGIQSVKMPVLKTTGKNLISNWYNGEYIDDTGTLINKGGQVGTDFITIPTQGDYVCEDLKNGTVRFFDSNKQLIEKKSSINKSFNVPTGVKYVTFNYYSETYLSNLQLEKGTQSTPYEPYKSNILTVNEEVELRGIGDVQDELNLLTGELTERIGEMVFDGSEKGWHGSGPNFRIIVPNIKQYQNVKWGQKTVVSNLYPSFEGNETDCYIISEWSDDQLRIHDVNITLEELKAKLAKQPLYVAFLLSQESVKTVDLSIVNQDGNNTKLSTFDDLTHVTLSSEGLIPEAELEVAEKVPEVAANMFTISREQEVINATTNEQSENVDATMIATTEIYEGLL